MASDDTMTSHSSMHEDEDEDEYHYHDHDHDHDLHQPNNLSRLSICSSSKHSMNDLEDVGSGGDMMMTFMSGLSIESSYADEESSDDGRKELLMYGAASDSDKDIGGSCLSLPGTPLQIQGGVDDPSGASKECCSENEAEGGKSVLRSKTKRNSRRRALRERWLEIEWEKKKDKAKAMDGESEFSMVTRPRGGGKSVCMDMEEVKACRDLGFELEYPRMMGTPSQISCSTIDTASSGGNSPIASWRISSPGDDPKDVKARLKVWAQAVATSASRLVG